MSTRARFRRFCLALATCTAAVATSSVLAPGTASADRATLRMRAQRAIATAERAGYTCRNSARVVDLGGGQSYVLNTTFFRANNYKLIGVGDDTVRDLDLELYDENWHLVSKDTSADNVPIVHVTPRWTGTFYYKVVMYRGHGLATAVVCYRR